MTIAKVPLQTVVTIALDASKAVTHAWQTTVFSIQEDGVEISRQQGEQVNLEPADIAAAVPQAEVLAQLNALKVLSEADATAAAKTLGDAQAGAAEMLAAARAEAETVRADLQGKLDVAAAKLTALSSHVGEAAKVLGA